MKTIVITTLLCFSTSIIMAQVGFLGKRFVVSGGTALAPPIKPNYWMVWDEATTDATAYATSDWSMLPPEMNLTAEFVLTERLQVAAGGSWRGLRNTIFYSDRGYYDYPSPSVFYRDSFIMRNNGIDLSLNFKLFMEYAPVGKYVEFGGGMTHVATTVFPTYVTKTQYNSGDWEYEYDKREPGTYTNKFFHADFAIGQSALLTRKVLIDWGVKTSYFFGPSQVEFYNGAQTAGTYEKYFRQIIQQMQKVNLQDSYIFKLYVKLGFSL